MGTVHIRPTMRLIPRTSFGQQHAVVIQVLEPLSKVCGGLDKRMSFLGEVGIAVGPDQRHVLRDPYVAEMLSG